MAVGTISANALQPLLELLDRIEETGVARPENCLLSDYLQFLVKHQILSANSALKIVMLYYGSRYGGRNDRVEGASDAIADLRAARRRLENMPADEVRALAETLSATFAALGVEAADADDVAMPHTPSPDNKKSALPLRAKLEKRQGPFDQRQTQFRPPNPQARFRLRLLMGFVFWTAVVLAIGFFAHDRIESAVDLVLDSSGKNQMNAVYSGNSRSRRRYRLNGRRAWILAGQNEAIQIAQMKKLAREHNVRGESAEVFYIYERLLSRDPGNADLKNDLAWYMLTPRKEWYRDPVRALHLAEEAVQADPKPSYLVTLAEACFQNGDPVRASQLVQQAIAGSSRNHQYLEDQLKKFQQAANNASETAAKEQSAAN